MTDIRSHAPWYTATAEGDLVRIKGRCVFSKREIEFTVPLAGFVAFDGRRGLHIQDAMPNVSADHREFILSGIGPEAWDETCKETD